MNPFMRIAAQVSLALSVSSLSFGQHYTQVNLVANTSGIAPVTDPALINPWGLSRSSSSPWWVSDNGTGFSMLFNGAGVKNSLIVTIPKADPTSKTFPTGTPTGTIANNSTTDFILPGNHPASFLFSTLDGAIVGWNAAVGLAPGAPPPSTHAVVAVKTTDGSSYTGLTSAYMNGNRYLYAANFTKDRVDVYDNAFNKIKLQDQPGGGIIGRLLGFETQPFNDPFLPRNFVPFNVQAIGDNIVVTFALHQEGKPVETDGPGLGYVDIFNAQGKLLLRLDHGDQLNAPWGVALAPLDFGRYSHELLIGQWAGGGSTEGSGTIAAYDLATGNFDGLVENASGQPLVINGLWAITPGNSATPNSYDPAGSPAGELYFTAGPNGGQGGLFGYVKPVATELVKGNDQ